MISAYITVFPSNKFASEFIACVGIEPQVSSSTPGGKVLECDIHLFDNHPLAFDVLVDAIRGLKPAVVCGG